MSEIYQSWYLNLHCYHHTHVTLNTDFLVFMHLKSSVLSPCVVLLIFEGIFQKCTISIHPGTCICNVINSWYLHLECYHLEHVTLFSFSQSFSPMYVYQISLRVVLYFFTKIQVIIGKIVFWYSQELFTFVGYVKYQRCYQLLMSRSNGIFLILCSQTWVENVCLSFYFFLQICLS